MELLLPKRHPGQEAIFAERQRFNVAACGRRFGKTTLFLDLLIDDPGYGVLDGYPCAWFAGTSKIFDEVWRLAKETLGPVISRTDAQKHRLELVTGGILDFWSLEGGDRGGAGRGRKYRRVALDEVALVPDLLKLWQQSIRPTLIDYRGDAWFASTPKGCQNEFHDLWQRGQQGKHHKKGWKSWQLPSQANPYLSKEELADLKDEYAGRPLDYAQEILAEFVSDFGAVFKLSWINEEVPPKGLVIFQAWDLAVTGGDKKRGDFSVGVAIGLDSLGRWWLVDIERGQWTPDETVERILGFQRKHKASRIWIEAGPIGRAIEPWLERRRKETGQMVRYEFVSHSARADDLSETKFRGLRKVANTTPLVACMANGSFYVALEKGGGAPHWLTELKAELASFPQGKHDDQVDALSIAFMQAQSVMESPVAQETTTGTDPLTVEDLFEEELEEEERGSRRKRRRHG